MAALFPMPCKGGRWSHRESNPNLIFRRDLFYPLNYETKTDPETRNKMLWRGQYQLLRCKGTAFRLNGKIKCLYFYHTQIKLCRYGKVKSIV